MSRALKRSCVKRRSLYLLLTVAGGIASVYFLMSDSNYVNPEMNTQKPVEAALETQPKHSAVTGVKMIEKKKPQAIKPKVDSNPPKVATNDVPKDVVVKAKTEVKKDVLKVDEKVVAAKEAPKAKDLLAEIPEEESKLFSGNGDTIDFKVIAGQLRTFKKYHDMSFNGAKMSEYKTAFLSKIENDLFSWIKLSFKSTVEMRNSYKGSGIVICAGNNIADLALSTMRMIREVHQSDLPFEVFYTGDGDLSPDNRKRFEKISNTVTKDITKIFDNDILKISGWAIKGFAILASSFENAMLIDSDVVFIQSPETLFSSYLFKSYGALFFHDRSLYSHGDKTKNWFEDLLSPTQSEYSKSFRVFHDKTAHEQESGVVLINKKANLPGLMATCTLNVDKIRNLAYDFVFGDKETFWLGFEAVGQSYRFNGFFPGTLGEVVKNKDGKDEICGRQIMHVDEQQVPTWINGGIAESKVRPQSNL